MPTKFKTRENAKEGKPQRQGGKLITDPQFSISMREILQRFQRGVLPPMQRSGVYNEEFHYPDMDTLDLVDKHQLLDEQKEIAKNLKQKLNEERTQIEEHNTIVRFQKTTSKPDNPSQPSE